MDVFRSMDWLRIAPQGYDNRIERNFRIPIDVPGAVVTPGLYISISAELIGPESRYTEREGDLDWDKAAGRLEARNWRPGDQIRRKDGRGLEKIKILFQEARIPLWDRRHWPILTVNDEIVWAWQFGSAVEFRAGPTATRILRITAVERGQ